ACFEVPHDLWQMADNFHKPHKGQFAVMAGDGNAGISHSFTAPPDHFCRRIMEFQGLAKQRRLLVAAGLACKDEVLQKESILTPNFTNHTNTRSMLAKSMPLIVSLWY